jgi:hypothetical protein
MAAKGTNEQRDLKWLEQKWLPDTQQFAVIRIKT